MIAGEITFTGVSTGGDKGEDVGEEEGEGVVGTLVVDEAVSPGSEGLSVLVARLGNVAVPSGSIPTTLYRGVMSNTVSGGIWREVFIGHVHAQHLL